jgi:hypothetical protein
MGAWAYGNEFYYPPMHDPASFNLEAVKRQVENMIKAHAGQ